LSYGGELAKMKGSFFTIFYYFSHK